MMRNTPLFLSCLLLSVSLPDPTTGLFSLPSASARQKEKTAKRASKKGRKKAKPKANPTPNPSTPTEDKKVVEEKHQELAPPEPISYPEVEPCAELPEDMACVPGGEFLRGVNHRGSNARPQENVFVQTFYMDKFHVTYEQYQQCVKEGKCKPARPTYPDFNHPHQPMTRVSFYDALNYCSVHGKHLPTEAQWEKAARGTDGRTYPWGNEPITCKRAIFFDEQGRSCGVKQRSREADKGKPWDVGSRPPGVYGLYDMSGNSWAWVLDYYSPSYAACGKECQGVDPKGPCQGEEPCPGHKLRIVRGGSWYWGPAQATTYYRRAVPPVNAHHFGFRCAASTQEALSLPKQDPVRPNNRNDTHRADRSTDPSPHKG